MNRTAITPRHSPFRFLRSTGLALLALLGLLASSSGAARASCMDPRAAAGLRGQLPILPMMGQAANANSDDNSIVGLWYVRYSLPDGSPFNSSLDQWHSDGTEFENATVPPAAGNICFGVWRKTGPRTVKLHHIGWLFAPDGSLAGYFTLDEINTVSQDGATYTGSFIFQVYQPNGTPAAQQPNGPPVHAEGTMLGTRIRPDDTTLPM